MTEKGCYIRVGSASEPMPLEMIDSLYSRRSRNTIGRMESTRHNLTFEQLKIYYQAKGLNLNAAFMQNLELLTPEGKPNYAAYLLADENGVSIQIAKYFDTTQVDLIENLDFGRCSLVKAFKSVLERMAVENTIYTRIGYPLREKREMIHTRAIREAVINAVVHNDYSNGACPKFEFFSDRLEITSAGGLPYGVTEEDFFNGYSSPRNKEIMRVFRDLEIVEQLGSGIPRILEKYGRDAFEIRPNFLRVIFHYEKPFEELTPESEAQSAVILSALIQTPLSAAELAATLSLESKSGAFKRTIKELLQKQLIEYTLPDKPSSRLQKYRLTDEGKVLLKSNSPKTKSKNLK